MSDTEKWTVDDIEILIMEVRSRPEIYNQTLPGYANRDRIEKLWNEVARHLGEKSKTGKQCSKKWQILRGTYRTKKHEYTPSGSSQKNSKKWVYFDMLSFLDPYISERKTCSNYSSSIEKSQDSDVDHGDHPSDDYNIEDTEDANILIIEESTTDDLSFINDTCEDSFSATLKRKSPTPTTSATTYTNTNPKKSRKQGNEVNDIIAKYFTSKIENVPKHKEESSMELFLKSVGKDVGMLSPAEQLDFKLYIMEWMKNHL